MNLGRIFRLDESTVRTVRRCYNLIVTAASYALTILVLTLLAVGFSEVMERLAVIIGLDEKTQTLISYVGASLFVILILAGFVQAIGDALKLILYYIRDWSDDHDAERRGEGSDQE